jgi:hypothetical protein
MMPFFSAGDVKKLCAAGIAVLALVSLPALALDKPTGAPLVLSSIETEQGIPLAVLAPDGKTATCATVRLHWSPQPTAGADDEATSFSLDIAPDSPGASIFTAQLWNASLASALAWQQPWENARWKVLDTPATDGTGIDAALAVGMIATSARRPYPKDTVVIGSLKPDGTLGAVTRLAERLDAAAATGITRVIIPSVQRFDVDSSGQVLNMVRHAEDLHLTCVPVDNLIDATQEVMHDPLPEVTLSGTAPKYGNDVATYIDDFAHREQTEMTSGLAFAPKEADLSQYPAGLAATWKSVYADNEAAQQAYRAGQVYMAYRLFAHANGLMHGVNALTSDNLAAFDVKLALAEADDLRRRLHEMMTPPSIDQGELESAVLVSEMADWAYDIAAALEGAQLVTKQAFSQRSDATPAEKERAREAILFANAEARYLLDGADFYTGLLSHVTANPIPVDANAAHLLPQLIPAQLATAEIFTQGIRSRANALLDGLLFDPRLVAYINVLRETKTAWETSQHKKEIDAAAPATNTTANATKLNAATTGNVGFDPGNTYAPPHNVLIPTVAARKLSDVAACLIWVNNDCEIATLDEKYLHLNGTVDPATHEWHVQDRAKLDALLQSAEGGARLGITFAEKAEVDTSVLAMIFERASQLRLQGDDASGLDALRNYWRCALLGNMCWQLAHTHKAEPVNLAKTDDKAGKKDEKKPDDKTADDKDKDKEADKTATADSAKTPDQTKPAATNTDTLAVAPPPEPPPPPPESAAPAPATNTDTLVVAPASEPPAPTPAPESAAAGPASNADTVVVAPIPPPAPAPETTAAAPASNADTVVAAPIPAPAPAPETVPVAPADTNAAPPPRALPVTDETAPPAPAAPVAAPGDVASIPVAPVARTEDYTGASTNAPPANGPPAPSPTDKAATGGD